MQQTTHVPHSFLNCELFHIMLLIKFDNVMSGILTTLDKIKIQGYSRVITALQALERNQLYIFIGFVDNLYLFKSFSCFFNLT
jgi:hypothetical protein